MQATMCQQWNTARDFSFHWIWSCLTSNWTVDSKSICTEAVSGGINDDKRALPTLSLFCRLSVEAALLAWENGLIELLDWNCSRFQQTSNQQWKIVVSEEAAPPVGHGSDDGLKKNYFQQQQHSQIITWSTDKPEKSDWWKLRIKVSDLLVR